MLSCIHYAEGTPLLCHFGSPHPLIRPEESPKSNHSRTYAKAARKSNYSRTYAKTGGWGYRKCSHFVRPNRSRCPCFKYRGFQPVGARADHLGRRSLHKLQICSSKTSILQGIIQKCRRADIFDPARKQEEAMPARLRRRPLQKPCTAFIFLLRSLTRH